ncbi:MAG: hypothetical protein IPP86_06830 [Bacteroidetes bacterium]|nr:hypothetical protein [Bacteroidota bacterium]
MGYLRSGYIYMLLILSGFSSQKTFAYLPTPDHIVIVMMENHAYQEIVGSSAAPYINSLFADQQCALFTQSFGLSHPSQPNYLQFFSGSNQGVVDNNVPDILPFTTRNLGASLIAAGRTFTGYSEDLPSVGANDSVSGLYARKHNPWVNWQGGSTNGIPSTSNQPYTAFPSNFSLLPTVAFVVPNLVHGMHDGTDPSRIAIGDSWSQGQLDAYIQWAKTHNSLLVFTFDEDDDLSGQHILTFIIGQHVKPGSYSNTINHYNVLRMVEDMYSLPHAGAAASATTIDYCWNPCAKDPVVSGPSIFCQGSSATLTAPVSSSYLWSNGATTGSISVSTAGSYSVTITDANGCTSTSPSWAVAMQPFSATATVFGETMGTVGGTTTIAAHESANGFDNDSYTMTGSADIRGSSNSIGYATASGGANVFVTNTVGRNFIISGINTSGLSGLQLSFGLFKSTTASNGSDFQVLVSTDGTNYSQLSFTALPTGTGTAIWHYRTATGTIPSSSTLSIQFKQNGTATQYRLDDVLLTYPVSFPTITASGPTSFCQGGSVVLSCTQAPAYLWSNGATTSSVSISTTGNYSVSISGNNGCSATSNVINVVATPPPGITGFNPSTAAPGTLVTINGSNFSGATSVKLNGSVVAFSILNASQITFTVPVGAVSGNVTVITPCGTVNSSTTLTIVQTSALQIRLFIQGFYLSGGLMREVSGLANCDTVTVRLRSTFSPYTVVASKSGPLNTSGYGTFLFPSALSGVNYYLDVTHRNSLEVWSGAPVLLNIVTTNYDFTTSASQAYASNQIILPDGSAALYGGDVNQDGVVDSADFNSVENSSQLIQNGYVSGDLTGDLLVESSDYSLMENNFLLLLMVVHP